MQSVRHFVFAAVTICLAWSPAVSADRYDDDVERAEKLWSEGKKREAVVTYGRIWKLRPDDVDRQILYGRRSAEVGNYRWAINFFLVAEQKVADDPTRLYRVYKGIADTYRMSGYSNKAQPYEAKADALRDTGQVADAPPDRPTPGGAYTETTPAEIKIRVPNADAPPPPGVTEVKKPVRYLKKRIAVAPIGVAVGGAGLAGYGSQIQAMLITELRKTNRFIVVERENLDGLLTEQDLAASGRVAKGSGPKTGRLVGAQLMVKAEITDFDDQSQQGRRVGVGPVDWGRGRSVIRVGMDMRVYNTETGVIIASENVAAEKVTSSRDVGVSISAFRWNDSQSQSSTLGFVTRDLVQQALARIIEHSGKVPWTASVMRASGNQVYFNAGANAAVRAGDRFKVLSVGESFIDPDTGEVLATEEKEIAEIEVTKVAEKFSIAIVRRKTGEIKRQDKVLAREQTERLATDPSLPPE